VQHSATFGLYTSLISIYFPLIKPLKNRIEILRGPGLTCRHQNFPEFRPNDGHPVPDDDSGFLCCLRPADRCAGAALTPPVPIGTDIPPRSQGTTMTFDFILGAVVAAGLLVYLGFALLAPERF
jgi:K+-transporting ATPase KdpF subunit